MGLSMHATSTWLGGQALYITMLTPAPVQVCAPGMPSLAVSNCRADRMQDVAYTPDAGACMSSGCDMLIVLLYGPVADCCCMCFGV
jgi:hypothetical protein